MVAIRQETSVNGSKRLVGGIRRREPVGGGVQLNSIYSLTQKLYKWHVQSQTIFPGVGVGGRVIFKFARGSDS